jgi:hypothetical protein
MKKMMLVLSAAAALLAAPVQAAPKEIENDIRIYAVDTYKSSTEVADVLTRALGRNNITDARKPTNAVYLGMLASIPEPRVLTSLRKLGTVEQLQSARVVTKSGRQVPIQIGEVLELANGAVVTTDDHGRITTERRTRDLFTGVSLKATPTSMKNGDIKVAYEQRLAEIIDVRRVSVGGNPIDLAKTHHQNLSGLARVREGDSIVFGGFSSNGAKGLFGRKNRVVVTIITPKRH